MEGNVVDHEFVVGDFFIVEDKSTVPDVRQRALECEAVEVVEKNDDRRSRWTMSFSLGVRRIVGLSRYTLTLSTKVSSRTGTRLN